MGTTWGIVKEEELAGLARWSGVVAAGLTPRLVIPVGASGFEIARGDDGEVRVREVEFAEVLAEVRLLDTGDTHHDELTSRLDPADVYLPDDGGARPLLVDGFERTAWACGATRLLALDGNEVIDVGLRTAAQVALAHGLAIEFHHA